ncbi:hypothetical protein DUNSADRAFT_4783 [Dunaliella salina]|uniref:Encoded protein n=1 Tax=Dunaliella salina TaxID=3046 RepID=A0ABQ7GRC1_DUNSA|nr:hypothetical protein DUNSADRAFT_4783 [Dunaliella salina]|eukprot:KAF5837162.1 hypothetical protein DUNSADRAFT_4783 [Dunaliella salina]
MVKKADWLVRAQVPKPTTQGAQPSVRPQGDAAQHVLHLQPEALVRPTDNLSLHLISLMLQSCVPDAGGSCKVQLQSSSSFINMWSKQENASRNGPFPHCHPIKCLMPGTYPSNCVCIAHSLPPVGTSRKG